MPCYLYVPQDEKQVDFLMTRQDNRGMAQGAWPFPHDCAALLILLVARFLLLAGSAAHGCWPQQACLP